MSLLRALTLIVRNPRIDGEQFDRRTLWALVRPHWTHTIATTHAPCGCRRRFGLWHTLMCLDHVEAGFEHGAP